MTLYSKVTMDTSFFLGLSTIAINMVRAGHNGDHKTHVYENNGIWAACINGRWFSRCRHTPWDRCARPEWLREG